MKNLILCLTMVGCTHATTFAPKAGATPVLGESHTHLPALVVNAMGTDADNPYRVETPHTWVTLDDIRAAEDLRLQLLMREEVRKSRNGCATGDPTCSIIGEQ